MFNWSRIRSIYSKHRIGVYFLCLMILWGLVYAVLTSKRNMEVENIFTNPLPIPEFMAFLEPYPGQRVQKAGLICFTLFQSELWEAGYSDDSLTEYLIAHLQVDLDQRDISAEHLSQTVVGTMGSEYDDQGKLLGSYGGPITTCYEPTLSHGLHSISVAITTMSGVPYFYEWAFEIVP